MSENAYVKCGLWNRVASIWETLSVLLTRLYTCTAFYFRKFHSYFIIISTSMKCNVQIVISFKKLKQSLKYQKLQSLSQPSPSNSLHASSPNDQHHGLSPTTPLLLGSLWPWCIFESTSSLRLIQHPQSGAQKLSFKFERMETFLKDSGFNSVGEFLKISFYSCLGCLEAYEILPAVSRSHSF